MAVGCGGDSEDGETPPYPGVGANGEVRGERRFSVLMENFSQGQVRQTPWVGSWFPYSTNGISEAAATYEKASGRTGAVSWERAHHGAGLPGLQSWWGHCNGWAAAATLYEEPRSPREVQGVGFSVSDRKALLTEVAMEVNATFFGRRYEGPSDVSDSDESFKDIYPNQFFLVLTNYVGRGLPLVMDRYTGSQVWNHPIAGYQVRPLTESDDLGPAPGQPEIHRIAVTLTVWWARDDVEPGQLTESFAFADGASFESRVLKMELWLDGPPQEGKVILARQGNSVLGGAWKNGNMEAANSHPDYLWAVQGIRASSGYSNPEIDPGWVVEHLGR